MKFDSLAELIAMEGHGVYVWSAYGLFFLAFTLLVVLSASQHKRWLSQQRRLLKRQSQPQTSAHTSEE
ncbi:MAG: heme exporter protein CcmD [Moraxellaceae bacterium]|nr:heme exporter protein CcmD [Moraxellaceae bacterium]MDZ4298890.1 heme exporter protein CcmD [Moraxellaceae bacterium]MDZ4387105.1 heme exporter protein CcmD [Moraxellaceae bacterium]